MSAESTIRKPEGLRLEGVREVAKDLADKAESRKPGAIGQRLAAAVALATAADEIEQLRARVAELEKVAAAADDLAVAAEYVRTDDGSRLGRAIRAYDAVREGRA